MANKVCQKCKKAIVLSSSDIVNNPVDGKYYHIHCYEEWQWRKQLFEYICDLWNLKAPGPANYKLRKLYKEQLNCTDLELLMCLKYAYEVKRIPKNKAQSRIGIIPYIFEEAKEYYKKQEVINTVYINKMIENANIRPSKVLYVTRRNSPKKPRALLKIINQEDEDQWG